MMASLPSNLQELFVSGFVMAVTAWLVLSIFVILNRVLYERSARKVLEVRRILTDDAIASLSPEERSRAVRQALARVPLRVVFRVIADSSLPEFVTETFAAYSLEQRGIRRMIADASSRRGASKWRRIAALNALTHTRSSGVHALLRRAVLGRDEDVAGAAITMLGRLRDHVSAGILIEALRAQSYAPSRIATQLETLGVPIGDHLVLLLDEPLPHVRYWAIALLSGYPEAGAGDKIAALTRDPEPMIRKRALATLSATRDPLAVREALGLVDDPVTYVRSQAARSLAEVAQASGSQASERKLFAAKIAPLLADVEWDVRQGAKEALVALGPDVWPEVSPQLESVDQFARNGAAEIFQNMGLLDKVIDEIGRGFSVAADSLEVLERVLEEGGPALVRGVAARVDPAVYPTREALLARLKLHGVKLSINDSP